MCFRIVSKFWIYRSPEKKQNDQAFMNSPWVFVCNTLQPFNEIYDKFFMSKEIQNPSQIPWEAERSLQKVLVQYVEESEKICLKFLLVAMLFCLFRSFLSLFLWGFVVLFFPLPLERVASLLLCFLSSNKIWACLLLGHPISRMFPVILQ